jgi:hypothetical protein
VGGIGNKSALRGENALEPIHHPVERLDEPAYLVVPVKRR